MTRQEKEAWLYEARFDMDCIMDQGRQLRLEIEALTDDELEEACRQQAED